MDELDLISTNERTIIDFRKWNISGIVVIGHYKYNHVHPHLPRHQHPNMIEVVYCAKGEQTYEVDGQLFQIKGGDVFVTMPDEIHSSAGFPEDKGELYWIIIHPSGERILNFEKEEAKAINQTLLQIPNRHFHGNVFIKKTLDDIMQYQKYDSLNLFQRIKIKYLVEGLLMELIDAGSKQSIDTDNAVLDNIRKYVDQNIKRNIRISELAAKAHLSESRFKAWFKQETGVPPLEFVLRRKIQFAADMLQEKKQSIAEVAYELEFSSPQYFAKVFRKFTGKNPAALKKI